jgi:hypothetical protein
MEKLWPAIPCLCQICHALGIWEKEHSFKVFTKTGVQDIFVLTIIIWLFWELFLLRLAKPALGTGCHEREKKKNKKNLS